VEEELRLEMAAIEQGKLDEAAALKVMDNPN
jgi:hypothetical protein